VHGTLGLVSPKGLYRVEELLAKVEQSQEMPELARQMFKMLNAIPLRRVARHNRRASDGGSEGKVVANIS
jgi:hypothetical protein